MALLEVDDLSVSFNTPDGVVKAVRHVSFTVEAGKTLGIVGESGSGKSVSTQTIMGLTRGATITGRALFEGKDLFTMEPKALQAVRGAQIAMIFQDPLSSLHPFYKVGWQIVEMIRAHDKSFSKAAARTRAIELLALVGIPQPARRVDDYPHQFSGGMRQRAMIAMAMALNPKLLIADEPTTALDVTVQAQVLEVMAKLQQEFGTAIIMITHDLGVIADIADDVVVMYAGRAVEKAGSGRALLPQPPPVHRGSAALAARLRRRPRAAAADPGPAAEPDQPAVRLQLPPALPLRHGHLRDRGAAAARDPGADPHVSACWLPTDPAERLRERERLLERTSRQLPPGRRCRDERAAAGRRRSRTRRAATCWSG